MAAHFGADEETVAPAAARGIQRKRANGTTIRGPPPRALARYCDGASQPSTTSRSMNGTDVQKRVWAALRSVAAGRLPTTPNRGAHGSPASPVRAVGAANGATCRDRGPCNSIIGSNELSPLRRRLARKGWRLRTRGTPFLGGRGLRPTPARSLADPSPARSLAGGCALLERGLFRTAQVNVALLPGECSCTMRASRRGNTPACPPLQRGRTPSGEYRIT